MEEIRYYSIRITLNGTNRFLVWFSGDEDGVLAQSKDSLLVCRSLEDLVQETIRRGIKLMPDETAEYDWDHFRSWFRRVPLESSGVVCNDFLDTWNILGDMAFSMPGAFEGFAFLDGEMSSVYQKLFRGCNLPVFTKEGEEYVPDWSEADLAVMAKCFASGIQKAEPLLHL